jgi:hypothetical protein
MTGLSDYEAYLDKIDASMRVEGDRLTFSLGKPFSLSLSECATDAGLSSQMRQVMPRLLDDYAPAEYTAARIINIARPKVRDDVRAANKEKFYRPHSIATLADMSRSAHAPLQFINAKSQFARRDMLTLERDPQHDAGMKAPTVRVICTAPAYLDCSRVAEVSAVELLVHGSWLVISFDPATAWVITHGPAPGQGAVQTQSRFALDHRFSPDELERVVADIRSMFEGLPFSHTVLA